MSDGRLDLPNANAPNFTQRVRETIQTYLGRQGDPLDRGLTVRDLLDAGLARLPDGWALRSGSSPPLSPALGLAGGGGGSGSPPLDTTPPPVPTGFAVDSGVTSLFITHDNPAYTAGGGHLRTRVYGATYGGTGPLPTFSNAVELSQFQGVFHAIATNPATTWRVWIRWESRAGVLGEPAGGTNGLATTTGQNVTQLLQVLQGQITESQLAAALGARINLIDAPSTTPGSVAARIKSESDARVLGDSALAQQIASLAVSSDPGFDAAKVWYFDTAVEGWTSNGGAPTLASGWLRPANHPTDPFLLSPTGLGVTAATYNTVQARVRKVGSPGTWSGELFWKRTTDASTDEARKVVVAEPTWTAGVAVVAWDVAHPLWTGTIDLIRLDFSSLSDATNYYEVDWVGLGRRGPAASTASVASIEQAKIGYCSIAGLTTIHGDRAACEAAGGTWNVGLPWATAVRQVSVNDGVTTAAIEQRMTAYRSNLGTLNATYAVRVDAGGKVAGFGLAANSDGTPNGTTTEFAIRVDRFFIAPPATGPGSGLPQIAPLIVQATPTTINGQPVPAGVYIDTAFIRDGTITNAKIANAAIDNAKIANLSADKITGSAMSVGAFIQSTNYTSGPSGLGWRINADGTADFQATYIRGQITASQIDARGLTIRDAAGNPILTAGASVAASSLNLPGTVTNVPNGWLNSSITVSGGTLNGVGTTGVQVDNSYQQIGQNLMPNSDMTNRCDAVVGWNPNSANINVPPQRAADASATFGFNWSSLDYLLIGGALRNGVVRQLGITAGTVGGSGNAAIAADIHFQGQAALATGVPVVPGRRYCFSVYVNTHRCDVAVGIAFIDATNNWVAGSGSESASGPFGTGGLANVLSSYGRPLVFATAPAGAIAGLPYLRKRNTYAGQPDSWVFWAAPMFEEVAANATGPAPYMPGPINAAVQVGYTGDLAATRNVLTRSSTAPPSPANGDIWVDISVVPNVTRVRVAGTWQVAANNTTDTNQLTDGAGLGNRAVWTQVTGPGRPQDNATRNIITRSATQPASPAEGDVWVNTSDGSMQVFTGGSWQTSATVGAPTGTTVGGVEAATLVGNVTAASNTANTANTNATNALNAANLAAANASSALTGLNDRLSRVGADTLQGPIGLNTTAAILVGTTTTGLYLGSSGIVGRKNGSTTFAVTQAGDATFAGQLQGATGTFAGSLSAASGSFTGSMVTGGNPPQWTGSAVTGAGARIESNGTFVLGNSTASLVYNGSSLFINGPLVGTNNVLAGAVTVSVYGQSGATVNLNSLSGEQGIDLVINPGGGALLIQPSLDGTWYAGSSGALQVFFLRVYVAGVLRLERRVDVTIGSGNPPQRFTFDTPVYVDPGANTNTTVRFAMHHTSGLGSFEILAGGARLLLQAFKR